MNKVHNNIVITKTKKEITLDDILKGYVSKGYDGEKAAEEFDWGAPVGKEVW